MSRKRGSHVPQSKRQLREMGVHRCRDLMLFASITKSCSLPSGVQAFSGRLRASRAWLRVWGPAQRSPSLELSLPSVIQGLPCSL